MSNDCLDNFDKKPCPNRQTDLEILVPGHMQILAEVDKISGRAKPGATVTVRVDNLPLEKVKVRQDGTWQVCLECALPPGCHVVFASSSQPGQPYEKACFMVGRKLHCPPCGCHGCPPGLAREDAAVAFRPADVEDFNAHEGEFHNDSRAAEAENEGPCLELPPSPQLLAAPEISFPSQGQEISDKLPIVTGRAEARNMVIVCIRGMMCSRTMADEEGNFSVSFPRELEHGSYTVTALQADSRGNRSELTDHSFTVAF